MPIAISGGPSILKPYNNYMSVIQSIRDKYAKWAVVAIALALLGFILTDYLSAKNKLFGSNSTTLGSVNGKKINYNEFAVKLQELEDQAEAQGQSLSENDRHTKNEQLWNQEVDQVLMEKEFSTLGFDVGKKELNDWLFGFNPPQSLAQQFTQNGQYNAAAAQEMINQMRRSANQAEKNQLNIYLSNLEYSRKLEKYNSLLSSSVYLPTWLIEKQNAENSAIAKASYVVYPYASINDTTIKISDKEIQEQIGKNKDLYKQAESRSIAYVVFDAAPTSADTMDAYKRVADLKQEFIKSTDPAVFLARYGSTQQFFDGFNSKTTIQVPNKDSIFALSDNAVFGPYLDAGSWVMAKKLQEKMMPDSVKARHILIQTFNPQTNQTLLADSVAKNRIDSIETAVKKGARFDSLAVKYSDDKGSGALGGLLSNPQNPQTNYYTQGQMVTEFNDFSFQGKTGEKKVVKTIFGYHFIEILDQKNFNPNYKIAYFGKNIVASDETDRSAQEAASKFAAESRDLKSFDATIEKNKSYKKLLAGNIKPNDILIEQLSVYGTSRQLVKDIYNAKKGEVLTQARVGDKYVVAAVTEIFEEGTMPVAVARPQIEASLRNKKKAELIKQKIGKISTPEALAASLNDSTIKVMTADSIKMSGSAALGYEPRVLGAIFNAANKGKVISEPLEGQQGVYVVRVDDQSTTPNAAVNIEAQRQQMAQNIKQFQMFYGSAITILRKQAKIKDYRRNFY
jgi:peptidyl-prolyl cis-trans isomerase D